MEAQRHRSPPLRIASVARERLRWPRSDYQLGDRATIARTLGYLFGLGGVLLLATLLVPGSPGRESGPLIAIAVAALVTSATLIGGAHRLPVWFLKLAPALGSVLIALIVYFAGPGASAAYAMFLSWVVIAAGCFFGRGLALAHGVVAVGVFAVALHAGGGRNLIGLQLIMTGGSVGVAALIISGLSSQTREVLMRLEQAARTDALTGLLNRRALELAFDLELTRARRTERPCAAVLIDLDRFKRYNDANGHLAGDSALRRIGHVLREGTRAIDTAARLGGEEFAVLAPECDTAGALALAERLRRAIEVEFSGATPSLTASCGVASHPADGPEQSDLLSAADQALYSAKAHGRNRAEASPGSPATVALPLPAGR